jgi:hypothetical protein
MYNAELEVTFGVDAATRAQRPQTKLPRKESRIAHMAMSQIVPPAANIVNEVSVTQKTMEFITSRERALLKSDPANTAAARKGTFKTGQ